MNPVPLLDLKAQFAPMRKEIEAAMARVVEAQAFILGEEVQGLEDEVAAYTGADHAIGCASGTDALILALAALDIGPGDEIVTSAFSFFSTASCAYRVGARPVFADIDPQTFNLDPDSVASRLSPKVRAILPVHLFGQCADLDRFGALACDHDLPLVEDAAQALGTRYRSTTREKPFHAGAYGKLGCYSFFPTKNLGGFGDGGMVVTSDGELAEKLRLLRVHGGRQMYHHQWVGWNSRLDAIQAAVLRVKLRYLDSWSEGRRANADRYDSWFRESGLIASERVQLPHRDPKAEQIFNQYTLRVTRRDELLAALQKRGIGHSVYYPVPLHQQECFSELGYREGDLPETERACREVLSLPIYPELTEEMQRRVAGAVIDFYSGD